jgi:hypothetical protein
LGSRTGNQARRDIGQAGLQNPVQQDLTSVGAIDPVAVFKMQTTAQMIDLKDVPDYLNPTGGAQGSFNPQIVVPLNPDDPGQRLKLLDQRGEGLWHDPRAAEPEVQQVPNDNETATRLPGDPLG